jgi:hypothetical protein
MNVIEEIKLRLQKYPYVKYDISPNEVRIYPTSETGFTVSLIERAGHYTVNFNSWHEEYLDADAALNCFAFGLSDRCRLRVTYRGQFPQEWLVEEKDEDNEWYPCDWIGCNTTGMFFLQFWLKKSYKYLQNDLIKTDESAGNNSAM